MLTRVVCTRPRRHGTARRRDGAHDPADGGPATTAVPCAVPAPAHCPSVPRAPPAGFRPGDGSSGGGGCGWRRAVTRCGLAYRTITSSCSIVGF